MTRVRGTDLRVESCEVELRPVTFRRPLHLAGGPVDALTEAKVVARVVNRAGGRASGRGTMLLSHPWAYGASRTDPDAAGRAMEDLVRDLARAVAEERSWSDPFEHADRLEGLARGVPPLAGLLCLAPIDAAVHDGWARAAGADAYGLYGGNFVARDLGSVFGASMRGHHIGDFLSRHPARRLPVSHVVGTLDPLSDVRARVLRERVSWLKVKISGADPAAASRRVTAVVATARSALAAAGVTGDVRVSLDPNESFQEVAGVVELLDRLEADDPGAAGVLAYLEQPFPRHQRMPPDELRALGRRRPLLLDEGLDDVRRLPELVDLGWTGTTVKIARTQSQALRAAAFAARHRLPMAIQDLTHVGRAVLQSARLASVLPLTFPAFELNSRDHAPEANVEAARGRPELFDVRDGHVALGDRPPLGLY